MKEDTKTYWMLLLMVIIAFVLGAVMVWLCQSYGIGCNDLGSPNCTTSLVDL